MRSCIGVGRQRGSPKDWSQKERATAKLTSIPIRSMSSKGPIRRPPPSRTIRSISSCGAIPSPSIRNDSRKNGRTQRLATKPTESRARIGVRPIPRATSVASSSAGSPLSSPATTSTSCMRAGGLKKCMPTIRVGSGTAAAIAVTEREEVLVARTVSGPQAAASRSNRFRFRSRSSGAASITRSQSFRTSTIVSVSTRSSASIAFCSLQRPRSAPRRRPPRSCSRPRSRALPSSS